MPSIKLYDTMTRKKQDFIPADPKNVRFYVCGPTVYDRPHIGNARSVVVYDVLFRLLRLIYGEAHVTYARNITDVDDKINAAATERGISISALTDEVTRGFHADMDALGVLRPTIEPRATAHMADIIAMIERLIANKHAYMQDGHVLFAVDSVGADDYYYGQLSGRKMEDQVAGARVEVQGYKKSAGDFVLWKPASEKDDASSVFDSPWGAGRPGWHIECSAMSTKHLGQDFDLHGGGADLMFPHHENEIAQSRCAHPGSRYAKLWVHNGFLTVNGEKMSKSLGNFVTVQQLREKGVKGEVIRYALLSTHYRKPLDWSEKLLEDAEKALERFYRALEGKAQTSGALPLKYLGELAEDLNVPAVLAKMHELTRSINRAAGNEKIELQQQLKAHAQLVGLLEMESHEWLGSNTPLENEISNLLEGEGVTTLHQQVQHLVDARIAAKKAKDWKEADRIRDELAAQNILLEDKPDGTTGWRLKA